MSNGAGNPYLVQTAGILATINKAVVGKDKHELQQQVADLKRQRDELKEAEKEAVAEMRFSVQFSIQNLPIKPHDVSDRCLVHMYPKIRNYALEEFAACFRSLESEVHVHYFCNLQAIKY